MFNPFRSSYGTSLFSEEFLAGFFSPQFDPFMRLPSMDPYFSGHARVPKTQIVCIEVIEAVPDAALAFVLPSIVEPVEESDEESIEEISSDEDEMDVTKEGEEDHLTVHDITGQNFVISCPESNSYLVDSGYASDEEDNDEEKSPNNNNNNSPNVEMSNSEQSMSESDSDSHSHRYKHEHEKMKDGPRHHIKRTMKEERYFEDSSRHKKRSKTEKTSSTSTSVKWDWNQNKFV